MDHLLTGADGLPDKNGLSDSFVETMWDTLISLAMAAGICISLISLAVQLNKARSAAAATPTAVSDLPALPAMHSQPRISTESKPFATARERNEDPTAQRRLRQ